MAERSMPPWWKILFGAVVAGFVLYLPYGNDVTNNTIFAEIMYLSIAAMGLNLLTGFNGQISIGHGAFFGVGAFTSAILVVDYGWPIEATIPVGALLAAGLGILVGIPALRVKGLYLALVTLGLAVMFPRVVGKYVNGLGNRPLLRPSRSEVSSLIDGMPDDIYRYYVCLFVMVVLFLLVWNLMRSRAGRAMIAVRDQETAASTVGVGVAQVKVTTFAISAAYAGVAGSLSVLVNRTADASNPLTYFQFSIEFLIAVVIGGAATIAGPFLGAALLVTIRRQTEGTEAMAPALLGGALIVAMYVLPDGIVGGFRRLVAALRRRRAAPPPTPDDPTGDDKLSTAPTTT